VRPVGRLHVLTDTSIQQRYTHAELASRAVAGGADTIQYRAKADSTREMIAVACELAALCRRLQVPFIVNDRVDVALAADAQGVHLGTDDFPVSLARQLLGPDRIIGASAGTPKEAVEAEQAGADYLGVGPLFATTTKTDAGSPLGAAGLRAITEAVEIPVIAIGGMDAERVNEAAEGGAYGIAVIGAVALAKDPEAAARELRDACDRLLGG
jgi:thiamine-phosphate pyrophosphorylase